MNDRIPVILDTDIGSDIDDAVCLAYLLAQPRCDLVGISTVSGAEPRQRAALADAVCRAAGRTDIPIHSGASVRMDTGAVVQPTVNQAVALANHAHRKPEEFASNTAVQWLHKTISDRPGELTLLAIGPMTNVGLLLAMDPSIAGKLKALVVMNGVFFNNSAWRNVREWNSLCDPLASAWIYRLPIASHRSIGLDVTTKVVLPGDEASARFRAIGGPLAVVADMAKAWGHPVTFHDPLAATCIFKPELCTWTRGTVEVELDSRRLEGLTHFAKDEKGPHEVAEKVDADAFFTEYFGVVSRRA